jgi:hypothetical protein
VEITGAEGARATVARGTPEPTNPLPFAVHVAAQAGEVSGRGRRRRKDSAAGAPRRQGPLQSAAFFAAARRRSPALLSVGSPRLGLPPLACVPCAIENGRGEEGGEGNEGKG